MRRKQFCAARRKYDGAPCQAKAMENGRCKLHGGMSTGPKTAEGRERIRASMKARWAALREAGACQFRRSPPPNLMPPLACDIAINDLRGTVGILCKDETSPRVLAGHGG
jgi:hypothetical protein